MKKIGDFVCKNKYLILIICVILMVPSLIGMYKTKINYDILVYLPEDIETLKGENILTDDFNMGAFSVTIVENMANKDLLKLESRLRKIDGVEKVVSITDITGTTVPIEMLPSDITDKVAKGDSELLLITFNESTSNDKTLKAVQEVRNITSDGCKVGGMSAMVLDTKDLFNSEMTLYVVVAVICCIIVLLLCLDSYIVPFLLIANIGVAILFNMGSNIFLGNICYITKAISSVLQLGVTTDFSIFLYHKYEKAKKQYSDKDKAMSEAITETLVSVVGSSLTTIAGFLALCTMNLTLGFDIGIVMAKGVVFGVLCVVTLFPALLLVFDKTIEKTKHKQIVPKFNFIKKFTMKYYKIIFIIFLILLIPSYYCQSKTNVYYKLDKSIPDNYGYTIANKELKEQYNIVSPEIILVSTDLKNSEINNMIDEIAKLDGIDFILSPSKLMELGIDESMLSDDIKSIFETKDYKMLLINSNYDIATNKLDKQIEKVHKIVKKYDKKAILAGEGPLMNDLVEITDQDFKNVNTTSIVVIFILMLIVLKSISLPIILVSAIELAIFINMGIPYLTSTSLPFIASVVIGTIQLGATIDYAILMTTKYLEIRKSGKDKFEAVKVALDNSVSSIFVSGMCFFGATFGVGLISKIDMIGSLCTLIARGAIISMIVVMTVLPSLLLIFDKIICKTTLGFEKGADNMKKNTKKTTKKVLAILAITFLMTTTTTVKALTKEETVYSKLKYNGTIKNTTVSEHLINDGSDNLNDFSTLKNITNVNGNEKFTQKENSIIWEAKGSDIYYEGTTNEKLPIDVKVTYTLNGKETSPKKMIGKKGNVVINIKFTNNSKNIVKINGKNETLYTPFVITAGTIISTSLNSNINVTNGKVINNGSSNVIAALATPGLAESLGIDITSNLNEISISYTTKSFKSTDIYIAATPKLLDDSDLDMFKNVDKLYTSIKNLKTAIDTIEDGSKTLTNSLSEFSTKFESFNKGMSDLNNGTKLLQDGYKSITDGTSNLLTASTALNSAINGTNGLSSSTSALATATKDYVTEDLMVCNTLATSLSVADIDVTSLTTKYMNGTITNQEAIVLSCIKQTKTLNSVASNLQALNEKINRSTTNNNQTPTLSELVTKINEGANSLNTGAIYFNTKLTDLNDSVNTLYGYSVQLNDASKKLYEGSNTITSGITEFNKTGISKIYNLVNGDIKNLEDKVKKLVNLGSNYSSFAGKNNNDKGTSKFIMTIPATKKTNK